MSKQSRATAPATDRLQNAAPEGKHAFQMVVFLFWPCHFCSAFSSCMDKHPDGICRSAGSSDRFPDRLPVRKQHHQRQNRNRSRGSDCRFSATGDNLIHSPFTSRQSAGLPEQKAYSFDYCYEHIAPFYVQQDVNWINQETLCTDELEPSTYPCFSTPGDCARALYRAGVRVFSLSNNHTYDKGASGIAATLRFWDSMPEDVVTTGLWKGESDYGHIPLQTVNGVTIAYLSYTEHTNGIPQNSSMTGQCHLYQPDRCDRATGPVSGTSLQILWWWVCTGA